MRCLTDLHGKGLLTRFVVDEAPLRLQLGHDVAPDYKKLGDLKKRFPDVPVTALTATATPEVRRDVVKTLGIKNARDFVVTFNRPNIALHVKSKKALRELPAFAKWVAERYGGKDAGIVYCLSRDDTTAVRGAINAERARAFASASRRGRRGGVQRGSLHEGARGGAEPVDDRRDAGDLRDHRGSGWASTSPTCATSCTTRRPSRWRVCTRKWGARGGTAMAFASAVLPLYAKSDITRIRRILSMPTPRVRRADRLKKSEPLLRKVEAFLLNRAACALCSCWTTWASPGSTPGSRATCDACILKRGAAPGRAGHLGGGPRHGQGDARAAGGAAPAKGRSRKAKRQNQGQTEEGAQEGATPRARAPLPRRGGRGRGQRSRGGRQHVRDVPNAHVAARSRFSSLRDEFDGSIGGLRGDGEWWYTFTTRLVCFATAARGLAR